MITPILLVYMRGRASKEEATQSRKVSATKPQKPTLTKKTTHPNRKHPKKMLQQQCSPTSCINQTKKQSNIQTAQTQIRSRG